MKKLEITLENAEAAFLDGDESQRKLLTNLWPDVFVTDPYLKACKLLGKTPRPPLADRSDADEVSEDAYHRLTTCIRAKNMIGGKVWVPNYDGNEPHYFPVWKKAPSGFGLAFDHAGYWCTYTDVGARLEYRTEALMLEGVKEFETYYQDCLN